MCVLSIKVPIRKKSGNLSYAPRIYIYIYRYKYVYISFRYSYTILLFCIEEWKAPKLNPLNCS